MAAPYSTSLYLELTTVYYYILRRSFCYRASCQTSIYHFPWWLVESDFQTCSALSSVIPTCLNYSSQKNKQTKKHCLLLFVSQDVGVYLLCPADELVTRSRGRYCRGHTPTALHSPDLELQFTSQRELLRDTLYIFPLPSLSHPPRLSISAYHDRLVVTGPVWPFFFVLFCSSSFVSVLWFAGFFSCVNGFVLFCRIPVRGPHCGFCFFSCASPSTPLSEHLYILKRGFARVNFRSSPSKSYTSLFWC